MENFLEGMKIFKSRYSLSSFVLAIVLSVTLLALIIFGFVNYRSSSDIMLDELRNHQDVILTLFAENIEKDVKFGISQEVFRKCRALLDDKSVTSVIVKGGGASYFCNFQNSSASIKSLPKRIKRIYFDDNEKELAAIVEISFNASGHKIILTKSKRTVLISLSLAFIAMIAPILLLSRSITKPINRISEILREGEMKFISLKVGEEKTNIKEINQLYASIEFMSQKAINYDTVKAENERLNIKDSIAKQLAHDIRSPLAALDMGIKSLKSASSSEVHLIRSAINRIHDIANNLSGKSEQLNSDLELHPTLLPSLIANIISEKRIEYRYKSNIDIDFTFSSENYGLFSNVVPTELRRIISNVMNNAVEAIGSKDGSVEITLDRVKDMNRIYIRDNGLGIGKDIIEEIFNEGFSSGKSDGTGLGLAHAKSTVEAWGGQIECHSEKGAGAEFIISIPSTTAPSEFVNEISIQNGAEIVIVDDDYSIHQVWRGRLQSRGFSTSSVTAFSDPEGFLRWLKTANLENKLFFIDYEFLGSELTGIDLINEFESKSIYLVTSRFEEDHIQKVCRKKGIPLVDKGMVGFIPISIEQEGKPKVVLIDDDKIMHMGWQMEAKNHAIDLSCFFTIDDFLQVANEFPKTTDVFVDSNLGNDIKGEVESKKIADLGFQNIYLATGYAPKEFEKPEWIKEVRGKKPDFS